MKVENGEWILTPAELSAVYEESGYASGDFSLIPERGRETDGPDGSETRPSPTDEQRTLFDTCLKVLGDPGQMVLLHYGIGDTTVSRCTLAESKDLPGTWVTLAQSGETLRISLRSALELRNLVYEVLAVDNGIRPTKLACDLSTEGALAFLALLDQYRRSWMLSLLHHQEPVTMLKLEDIRERLQQAGTEDFRWSLNLTDKLLPIPIAEMTVAEDPVPALAELEAAGILEAVDEADKIFEFTEAGRVLAEGNKQAASRMVLTRTSRSADGEPVHDVFVLTRTPFDLFLVLMGGAEASLTTLLPGDVESLMTLLFPADGADGEPQLNKQRRSS